MKDLYHNIKNGLYNFWYFRKEIWEFRNWDYGYNMDLLFKSLEATADCLEHGITESGVQDAKDIKEFIRLYKASEDVKIVEELEWYRNLPHIDNRKFYDRVFQVERARLNRAFKLFVNNHQGWWE